MVSVSTYWLTWAPNGMVSIERGGQENETYLLLGLYQSLWRGVLGLLIPELIINALDTEKNKICSLLRFQFIGVKQGLSTMIPLTFGAGWLFIVEGCHVQWRVFSSSLYYPLPARYQQQSFPQLWQPNMFTSISKCPWGAKSLQVRTINLKLKESKGQLGVLLPLSFAPHNEA